jgi:hypothetical protein
MRLSPMEKQCSARYDGTNLRVEDLNVIIKSYNTINPNKTINLSMTKPKKCRALIKLGLYPLNSNGAPVTAESIVKSADDVVSTLSQAENVVEPGSDGPGGPRAPGGPGGPGAAGGFGGPGIEPRSGIVLDSMGYTTVTPQPSAPPSAPSPVEGVLQQASVKAQQTATQASLFFRSLSQMSPVLVGVVDAANDSAIATKAIASLASKINRDKLKTLIEKSKIIAREAKDSLELSQKAMAESDPVTKGRLISDASSSASRAAIASSEFDALVPVELRIASKKRKSDDVLAQEEASRGKMFRTSP